MDAPSRPDARQTPDEATVEDLLALATYDYPIVIGSAVKVLKFRRLDAFTRFMLDLMPAPLFEAATQVIRRIADQPDEEAKQRVFQDLAPEEKANTLDMLRRNAVAVAYRPAMSHDGAPGTFPVALLDFVTLLRIYHENPPFASVPRIEVAEAESFRSGPDGAPGAAGPDGEAVRAEAEQLAAAGPSVGDA